MRGEHRPLRIAARYAALLAAVVFFTVPAYLYVEPPWRGLVVRAASAFVLGVALLELRRSLVERLSRAPASALDAARDRVTAQPEISPRLATLIDDVRRAMRSRRHFEQVFWPRLVALAGRPPVRPAVRTLGRGPSVQSLRAAVASVERARAPEDRPGLPGAVPSGGGEWGAMSGPPVAARAPEDRPGLPGAVPSGGGVWGAMSGPPTRSSP